MPLAGALTLPAEASSAVVGERKKNSTLWCACRATEHPRLITKADVQTQKGSKLAPVNSRVKGNSNKSKNRDATSDWWQVTKYRSTARIRSKASGKGRDTEERTHSSDTVDPNFAATHHGRSQIRTVLATSWHRATKASHRKQIENSLVTRLLELSRRR